MIEIGKVDRVEFMEEVPRSEYVELCVLKEKVEMLQRFLEMQQATEETIRMIFNWPSATEIPFVEDPEEEETTDDDKPKRRSKIDKSTIISLRKAGHDVKKICEVTGLTYSQVYRVVKEAGLMD